MKYLFTLCCALMLSFSAMAQSRMSDSEIVSFVVKEKQAGTSQEEIAAKLMKKGVSLEQLKRLKQMYDRQIKEKGLGVVANQAYEEVEGRMRKNNGEVKGQDKKTSTTMMADEEDLNAMSLAVSELYIDSTDVQLKKEGKKIFGHDIFNNKDLSFEPNMNIATPQNYVLGPGDEIYIDIYGVSEKSIKDMISPDGTITIEGYGPVALSGLTADQANAKLCQTVGSRYEGSQVKMTVGQTRTIMVNVMGEVTTPGSYTLSAFATVFHALYMAGGINEIGTLRNIKVFRKGKVISQVDIYDYMLNGRLAGNVMLEDNDVIMVESYDCLVSMTGKVKRPMYYEMKKTETVETLLKYAGGFASDAYTQSLRLVRKTGRQFSVYNVTESNMASFNVCDGDSLNVDEILNRYENMVEVKGAVFRPGMYQLGQEVHSVKSLLEMCEGVTEEAFTDHAVMHRMKEDRTLEVLAVDIEGILKGRVADVELRNEDVLYVPTKQKMMEQQTITIHGEVMFPGIYKYADNETVEDFILQAGGLKESASVMKVDVSRRQYDARSMETEDKIAEIFTLTLKDGFVIDGKPGFILQPYDEVSVRKSPTYNQQQNVMVSGEVNFSGNYSMETRKTRLSDLVRMAGGLTRDARVEGARLERVLSADERKRMESMIKMARSNASEKDSIDVKNLETGSVYSVGIELDKALKNPGSNADVELREGDHLYIPRFNGTVKINGAVMYPNTIAYVEGKSPRWYIRHAGGFGNNARKRKAYIIRQNGMVEKISSGTDVTEGSEIVVPEKVKKEANVQGMALLISAISALATVGAVLVSALK